MEAIQDWRFWLSVICVPGAAWVIKEVLNYLKDIRNEMVKMNINFIKQEERQLVHSEKLKDHELRIRAIEKK